MPSDSEQPQDQGHDELSSHAGTLCAPDALQKLGPDAFASLLLDDLPLQGLTSLQEMQLARNIRAALNLYFSGHLDNPGRVYVYEYCRVFQKYHEIDPSDADSLKPVFLGTLDALLERYQRLDDDVLHLGPNRFLAIAHRMQLLYELLGCQVFDEGVLLLQQAIARLDKEVLEAPQAKVRGCIDELAADIQAHHEVRSETRFLGSHHLHDLLSIASDAIQLDEKRRCVLTWKDRRWRIAVFNAEDDIVALVSEDDPGKLITVPFTILQRSLEEGTAGSILTQAEEHRACELRNQEILESYDIPDTRMIYYRVFPRTHNRTIASYLLQSSLLAATLRSRYPNIDICPITFSDNPMFREIALQVTTEYDKGIRHFFFELYAHGSPDSIAYDQPFTASELIWLLREFCPDAHFVVSTPACYGAGMRNQLTTGTEPGSDKLIRQLDVFLQTKPDASNFVGPYKRAVGLFGNRYYLYLMQSLQQGKSYGRAVIDAGERTKKREYTDSEALIQGRLITVTGPSVAQAVVA